MGNFKGPVLYRKKRRGALDEDEKSGGDTLLQQLEKLIPGSPAVVEAALPLMGAKVSVFAERNAESVGDIGMYGRCSAEKKKQLMKNLGKPSIRRMARRGGVKRMSASINETARDAAFDFLQPVVRDSVLFSVAAKRTTVKPRDVLQALKRRGRTMYGYDQ
eukprot:g19113.t1